MVKALIRSWLLDGRRATGKQALQRARPDPGYPTRLVTVPARTGLAAGKTVLVLAVAERFSATFEDLSYRELDRRRVDRTPIANLPRGLTPDLFSVQYHDDSASPRTGWFAFVRGE
jgi:hypothetical protein